MPTLSYFQVCLVHRHCPLTSVCTFCRCNTSAFRSSSTDWKKKAASDAQTLNEYTQLFGEGDSGAAADTAEPDGNSNMDAAAVEPAIATETAAEALIDDVAVHKQKQKGKRHKQGDQTLELVPVAAEPLKNASKQDVDSNSNVTEAVAAEQVQPSKKHKKKGASGSSDAAHTQLGTQKAMALLGFATGPHKQHAPKSKAKEKSQAGT